MQIIYKWKKMLSLEKKDIRELTRVQFAEAESLRSSDVFVSSNT